MQQKKMAQSFKTKVLTARKNLLLECLLCSDKCTVFLLCVHLELCLQCLVISVQYRVKSD